MRSRGGFAFFAGRLVLLNRRGDCRVRFGPGGPVDSHGEVNQRDTTYRRPSFTCRRCRARRAVAMLLISRGC